MHEKNIIKCLIALYPKYFIGLLDPSFPIYQRVYFQTKIYPCQEKLPEQLHLGKPLMFEHDENSI